MLKIEVSFTFAQLPNAFFRSQEAVDGCAQEATTYDNAVTAFELDGDEAAIWEALAALGYEPAEIGTGRNRPLGN